MKLYRICNKEEIDQIMNSEHLSNIGTLGSTFIKYNSSRAINNHCYDPKERYLHFFEQKDSIIYWHPNKGRYVCTYDIPDEILSANLRSGKYLSVLNYEQTIDIAEYAILSKMIKKDYLIKIETLKKDIDICDDDFYDSLENFYEIVYEKDKDIMTLKKII